MIRPHCALRLALPLAALAWLVAGAPGTAEAITFGEPDCADNATNDGCLHPNTVSVSGFRAPRPGEDVDAVAFARCSGSLLDKDAERVVILTAGHCVSFYIASIQNGTLVDVGVSFDALIERDIPDISATSWSPAQYVLGGTLVLPEEYGPQGLNAFNLHFDYGLVVLPTPLVRGDGQVVDLSGIDPVTLPGLDFLETIANPRDRPVFTAVGYGTGEAHNRPGEGGNKGGAVNRSDTLGVRLTTTGTAMIGFLGPNANLMMGSQNPARGFTGTCGGDSGGPIFYEGDGGEIQVAVTSSGDAICRGSAIMARTDRPEVQTFLNCAIGSSLAGIADCGCTEVDAQGECP